MRSFLLTVALVASSALGSIISAWSSNQTLQVRTTSGLLNGLVNPEYPHTRQFLGVPFALPPTEERRWLPPFRFNSTASILAHNVGPACPQQLLRNAQVYAVTGGNMTEFFPLETFSEDCLTLNIWAPASPRTALPVMVWYFGGGFVRGGTSSRFFNPEAWVERTQEHIVVTVNFRSNIFGFPNAAELEEQNLGLLDQRIALEWVRDNIARFGGDPVRIVKWGESAGAIASDFLNFAYPSDPIVSGMILDSGTALFPLDGSVSYDAAHTNFTFVARAVGCGLATSQIECMRTVPWQTIEGVIGTPPALGNPPLHDFQPVIDNKIVFPNYTLRYELGAVSPVPALAGTNQHELAALVPQLRHGVPFNATAYELAANTSFLCASAHETSELRHKASLTTYRYRYDGDFANISPAQYPGAYHASELPLIFGTAGKYHGASTAYEAEVGRKMQDLWLAFAKDPRKGLGNSGWPSYAEGKAVILGSSSATLPHSARMPMRQVDVQEIDGVCATLGLA